MKKIDYVILAVLLFSPVLVNTILGIPAICTINGDTNGWLGFFGAYVGAIIPIFILYRTRKWNKEDNDNTRIMQHKILQYQAKKVWFAELKTQLDDNYRLLDFQELVIIENNIVLENYQTATLHLMQLNKSIEQQAHSFDLCLGEGAAETKYVDCYNVLLKEYGMLVNDLILISNIGNIMRQGGDYRKYVVDSYNLSNNIHIKNNAVEVSPFLENINTMVCEKQSIDKIIIACQERMFDTLSVHEKTTELIGSTKILLRSKEQEIEEILK